MDDATRAACRRLREATTGLDPRLAAAVAARTDEELARVAEAMAAAVGETGIGTAEAIDGYRRFVVGLGTQPT